MACLTSQDSRQEWLQNICHSLFLDFLRSHYAVLQVEELKRAQLTGRVIILVTQHTSVRILPKTRARKGATVGREERVQALMDKLVDQATRDPGKWYSHLSSKVRYINGQYEVDGYDRGGVRTFGSAREAAFLMTRCVIEEVVREHPELKDSY